VRGFSPGRVDFGIEFRHARQMGRAGDLGNVMRTTELSSC
jgi:hypothetical protein